MTRARRATATGAMATAAQATPVLVRVMLGISLALECAHRAHQARTRRPQEMAHAVIALATTLDAAVHLPALVMLAMAVQMAV